MSDNERRIYVSPAADENAAMSRAPPVSGARDAPRAGLAAVEHLHRERFVTGSAGARGARSQYDFRPKCSYAPL